ncbi:MAG: enoyl-CoA hydratase [Acidimicrobiia bacterium]|nr:enoyl-CoA hydratase [Acidimicrobiia bacterium]
MELVRIEHDGAITRLWMTRPERRNALSFEMMQRLQKELTDLPEKTELVVLGGEGPVFSAGHDLSEMIDRDPGFYEELFDRCTDLMLTIRHLPQPVIARVHGTATAAGCQLVASCDLAVTVEGAKFATPGVKIGLFCSTPMVPVSRVVGAKRTMEMLLTGEPIDAPTALDWGLVNRVVPADALDDEIDDLAQSILRYSRRVIGIGKRAFYQQLGVDEPTAYDITRQVMASNANLADAQEGMSAFLEKRQPQWER